MNVSLRSGKVRKNVKTSTDTVRFVVTESYFADNMAKLDKQAWFAKAVARLEEGRGRLYEHKV
jgi:hypothetical protein